VVDWGNEVDEQTEYERQLALINHRAGERAHDVHRNAWLEHLKATIQFGVEAIRTAALINGGAVIASLALVGTIFGRHEVLAKSLIAPVTIFGFGALIAGLASASAYASQGFYTAAVSHEKLTWNHPYVEKTHKSKSRYRVGLIFHILCVILVLCSYACVTYGALKFSEILT
jgi:hypothetical protein